MSKKVTFIADFYADQIAGGGELVNEVLISGLVDRGYTVEKLHSRDTSPEDIASRAKSFFIVANFVMLSEASREALLDKNYAIFEHDHKYLTTRDPSRFPNYLAPENHVINRDFYKRAKVVFCQSNIHATVVQSNLLTNNIVNLGCSMWSDDHLDSIKRALKVPKSKDTAILASNNPVKGMEQARNYCAKRGIKYDLINPCDFDQLMQTLAQYETVVFFSQVLETFCRLVVEARILGCKVVTNNNNGCSSEPWFSETKGKELLNLVEERREGIIDKVASVVDGAEDEQDFFTPKKNSNKKSITVILNSYRRPYNLKRQIHAIRNQTVGCEQLWLWVNKHEDNEGYDYSDLGIDRIFDNDHNWKFYGRFAGALLADTEYVAIFDDDTIPGEEWFENCLDTMSKNEGIMGSAGYVQTGPRAMQYEPERAGWPRQNPETMRVDYVGHAWFFKREWLSHLWREKPATWDNGEDIHFSYTAQKYGGIQTFCPPHPPDRKELHGSLFGYELGVDSKATSNNQAVSHQQFFSERDFCIDTAIRGGWDTVNKVKTTGDNNDLE